MPMLKPIFLGLLLVGPLVAEPHPFEWLAGSYADADTRESWTTAPNRQAFGLSQLRSDGKAYLSERLHIYPEGEGYRLDLEMHFFDGRTQKLTLKGKAEGERGVRFIGPKESLYYFKDERGHLRVELTKKTKLEFDLAPLHPWNSSQGYRSLRESMKSASSRMTRHYSTALTGGHQKTTIRERKLLNEWQSTRELTFSVMLLWSSNPPQVASRSLW